MGKRRIYLDNSVIGGYFDKEFESDTKLFFKRILRGDFDIYFSDINEAELVFAPKHVRELKERIPTMFSHSLELDQDAKELGEQYIKEGILTEKSVNDAYHIAVVTVNRIDILVSWNFKHIVNFDKIEAFNSINLKMGYPEIDIRSPKELIDYEDKD